MKIAISAAGSNLDAEVDPRFGRCQTFIIIDPETMELEAVENSSASAAGGAGISAAQSIVDRGVQEVLTGNCGPNAYQVLNAAGIKLITGVSGKIKDVVEEYKLGTYSSTQEANVPDHFGMSGGSAAGAGPGMGRGGGKGMGGGRGMGGMGRRMGGGMGGGIGMMPGMPAGADMAPQSPDEELRMLKSQSQAIAAQLSEIQRRIDELEKK